MLRVWLFVVVFVGGPLLFHLSLRLSRRFGGSLLLAVLVAICVMLAISLRAWAGPDWGVAQPLTLAGLAAIWGGWIALLAFCVFKLRAADPSPMMRRVTAFAGPLLTTVPWFGFALAEMMAR